MRRIAITVSQCYARILQLRRWAYRHHLLTPTTPPLPTISVGSIIAGGAGKTPVVHWLVQTLLQRGRKPAILSRGYKRHSRGCVLVSTGVQPPLVPVLHAGDEPYWYALHLPVPVIVDKRRSRAAVYAATHLDVDTLILDDAFQHWQLHRHCDIVIVDDRTLAEQFLLPAGMLREPQTALQRAHLILTRHPVTCRHLPSFLSHLPCFTFTMGFLPPQHVLGPSSAPTTFLAFAGIARPDTFFQQLRRLHLPVAATCTFPDHHWYTQRDLEQLTVIAQKHHATALLTTEKDAVRLLPYQQYLEQSRIGVYVLPMRVTFAEPTEQAFIEHIEQCLNQNLKNNQLRSQ